MALADVALAAGLAFWFLLPAHAANPMAVVFGGGTPVDFGRTLRDGRRLFGDGKTWRGFVGGIASGFVLGLILHAIGVLASPRLSFGEWPGVLGILIILPFGALVGDLLGAFIKRRLGLERGAKAHGLDQYDYLIGTFLLLLLLAPSWTVDRFWAGYGIWGLGFIILITPFLHRVVNVIGYRWGRKREPW
jgi:CDP-2,3-bis-(O-geranylgeranyl)-sn-glycerol synthase